MSGHPPDESAPERTADGRWIVVGGRRWRTSDPSIPAKLRQELVDELMDARRAVASAKRSDAASDEHVARRRVRSAKVALGERGEPWWESPSEEGRRDRLEAAVLALARHRAPSTICPSDAARAVGGASWRSTMDAARNVVRSLAVAGEVDILQHGEPIDPAGDWSGPIRVRLVTSESARRKG